MKDIKVKVKLVRHPSAGLPDMEYSIAAITNAIVVRTGQVGDKIHRVGQRISEQQAQDLADNRNYEVSVVPERQS